MYVRLHLELLDAISGPHNNHQASVINLPPANQVYPSPRTPVCSVFPTCVFAGKFGLGVAHPLGALAVLLVAPVLAVLVSVASPAFRDAGPVGDTVEFLPAALDHRWQH